MKRVGERTPDQEDWRREGRNEGRKRSRVRRGEGREAERTEDKTTVDSSITLSQENVSVMGFHKIVILALRKYCAFRFLFSVNILVVSKNTAELSKCKSSKTHACISYTDSCIFHTHSYLEKCWVEQMQILKTNSCTFYTHSCILHLYLPWKLLS